MYQSLLIVYLLISAVTALTSILVQDEIDEYNIIGQSVERTLTACTMKCDANTNCSRVAVDKMPNVGDSFTCFMVGEKAERDAGVDVAKHVHPTNTNIDEKGNFLVLNDVNTYLDGKRKTSTIEACPPDQPIRRWPEGTYGILTRDPCPPNWFEFTQCIDIETTVAKFELDLGTCDSSRTSFTLRYCFKGANVVTRPGGFWTETGKHGIAFVLKNVGSECEVYGNASGTVYIDGDDGAVRSKKFGNNGINGKHYPNYYPDRAIFDTSANVFLVFCMIGAKKVSSRSDMIEIGEFNQTFGFLSHPNDASCPILDSPYGVLHAKKEKIHVQGEHSGAASAASGKTPFVVVNKLDITFGMCVYDPLKA